MPAAIAIPLITAGASAGASVIGSRMAANASKNAARTQSDAAMRAETDSRRSTADALAYIEQMRGQGGYQSSPTSGYLARLLGIPQRQAPMMQGGPAPMMKNAGMIGGPGQMATAMSRPDPYSQLFGQVQQAARAVGRRR